MTQEKALQTGRQEPSGPASIRKADWAVLSNGKVALSIQNTLIRWPDVVRQEGGMCGLGSGEWQYALKDGHKSPMYQVAIGVVGDLNGDKTADWQDGCIFLQRHVPGALPELIHTMLLGWVGVEDSEGNSMNATFPQVGDIIRRQYNITAGEPTAMGLAGWCYWGWDSEYPACEEACAAPAATRGWWLCKDAWRYGRPGELVHQL